MRALVQRVTQASVSIDGRVKAEIRQGFVIFLGVGKEDTQAEADRLWRKISGLRIFRDEEDKTNWSLNQVDGNVLVISQFTLFANCSRGYRPSFIEAAPPEQGKALYDYFLQLVSIEFPQYGCGEFGADMDVSLVNQGPFTIWLDTDNL